MLVTPHDTLFKYLFSDPRRATEILRVVLPPGLARRVDWSTLRPVPGSFIDEALRGSAVDLLFSATMDGRQIGLYVLFEHQSTYDRWMPRRLLRYMDGAWEAMCRASPELERLPVIVPVVLYHGERPWPGPTEFAGLFAAPPSARAFVPGFRFVLADLARREPGELRDLAASACVRLGLAAMQAARSQEALAAVVTRLARLVLEVMREPDEHGALLAIFRYLFEVRGADEYDAAVRVITREFRERGEADMETIAQMLERRGHEKGLEQGLIQGMQQGMQKARGILLRALQARFGEVSPAARGRVEAATEAELQAWVDRLFTAGSVAELLGA